MTHHSLLPDRPDQPNIILTVLGSIKPLCDDCATYTLVHKYPIHTA